MGDWEPVIGRASVEADEPVIEECEAELALAALHEGVAYHVVFISASGEEDADPIAFTSYDTAERHALSVTGDWPTSLVYVRGEDKPVCRISLPSPGLELGFP